MWFVMVCWVLRLQSNRLTPHAQLTGHAVPSNMNWSFVYALPHWMYQGDFGQTWLSQSWVGALWTYVIAWMLVTHHRTLSNVHLDESSTWTFTQHKTMASASHHQNLKLEFVMFSCHWNTYFLASWPNTFFLSSKMYLLSLARFTNSALGIMLRYVILALDNWHLVGEHYKWDYRLLLQCLFGVDALSWQRIILANTWPSTIFRHSAIQ